MIKKNIYILVSLCTVLLAISIEARKQVGESYSIIREFFKESELIYVVADVRNLIGLKQT
ncbi:DUF4105 domain-containing protein [Sulfurimonas sp.]|uniref:DUF4105 domain-containing protein n=1 Tax=Sulfurimonas sp. TaxID=2022749 RepID=UPI003A7F4C45